MTKEDKDMIEQIIDRNGLHKTLLLIEDICFEKAEHVRTNWQDEVLSKMWEHAANQVNMSAEFVNQKL